MWQVLDVGSVWMKEFASALSGMVPTVCWSPAMRYTGVFEDWERSEHLSSPPLEVIHYPLQRGYARAPFRWVAPYERGLLRRLAQRCSNPASSPLICSTPFYAPLAERWPGPVVYYVTDLTASYATVRAEQVIALDQRMCRIARSVCPNSSRIAQYLIEKAGCAPEKITIVPNATRASNLTPCFLPAPESLPSDLAHLRRPIAGIIGNLAANMDWCLLAKTIEQTAWLTWVFVGPTSMPITDREQREARAGVMRKAVFTGAKGYGELQGYARCFDVAILPYIRREPTYSGSSTRFYEHLAACRPMVATRGFAELLEKPPLLELVDTAGELVGALERLRAECFHDGFESLRWEASRKGTWETRARAVIDSVGAAVAEPCETYAAPSP